eukprot:COSAG02_NODE_22440_length_752_cov_2.165391_2_plen_64_part_01
MVAGPAGASVLLAALHALMPPAAATATAVRVGCNESAFPHSLNDTQCYSHGAKHVVVGANDAAG